MTMKRLVLPVIAAIVALGLWSCYPGSVTVSELDSVLTLYDSEQDFQRFRTYHLPDTILEIGDPDNEISDEYDEEILQLARDNMADLGWVEVEDINDADVVLLAEKSRSDLWVAWNPCPGCWCGYWCWYPGWPWYGGSPYYPWGGVVYSYPVGTVYLTMYDATDEAPMGDQPAASWTAAFNGLVQGSASSITARIDRGIDQAFDQSPYLELGQ